MFRRKRVGKFSQRDFVITIFVTLGAVGCFFLAEWFIAK